MGVSAWARGSSHVNNIQRELFQQHQQSAPLLEPAQSQTMSPLAFPGVLESLRKLSWFSMMRPPSV